MEGLRNLILENSTVLGYALAIQVILSLLLLLIVFNYPVVIYRLYQRYIIFKAGFQKKKLKVSDNFEFEYIERGNAKDHAISLLLVHGFTSSKENWCLMASFIPKRIHIVALDLPGHGGTTRKLKDDVSVPGFAKRVEQFANAVGLNKKKYHVVGTSLGGFIAGVHAAMFPKNLASVMLVCPAGFNSPVASQMVKAYEKENKIQLLPKNNEEFVAMINMLVHKPVKFPDIIVSGLMQARLQAQDFYVKVFEGLINENERYLLQEKLPDIKTKTMIVWGKHDKALDVSATEVIRDIHPESQIEILDDCGHSIALERPRKLATLITRFLED
ncbi:monoacylglycerol lipase ABHD6-like [Rhopilema esculentum]|uniref:monoacylglycerol lipase ABHD6-like n=1 Tax=Rhopilema esculentum TaxID=499914 RepID=UPI0031CF1AB7|eukprot:gene7906-13791_t